MRILMISDVYFPRINGVSTSIRTFKKELEKQGHQVYVIAPEYDTNEATETGLFRVKSRTIVLDPEDRMMRFRAVLQLLPELRKLEIDLVHIQTPFVAHYAGIRLGRALHVPCICTYHTLFEEYFCHYLPWIPGRWLRYLARQFSASQCNAMDGVIAPSSLIQNLLSGYGVRNLPVVIPTGIDSRHFAEGDGDAFRRRLGVSKETSLLLNVSRIAFEKNIGLLLLVFSKLLQKLPDVHLLIAGDGPAKESLMQQVSELHIEQFVSFAGYLDRDTELVDCYHAADLFVFSSRTETQGLVLLEAMASGLPVVSVAEMGTRDVLKHNTGVLITDGSVDDFRDKIISVLSQDDLKTELSRSARAYALEWDSAELARKLASFSALLLPGSRVDIECDRDTLAPACVGAHTMAEPGRKDNHVTGG